MRKLSTALYFLLIASLSCSMSYADDDSILFKDSCMDYCPRISFINFSNNQVSSLTMTEQFSEYVGDKQKTNMSGTLTYYDEKIINNGEQFMDIYNNAYLVDTPLDMRSVNTIYNNSVKNFLLQVNSINGVAVDNCIIKKESIRAPSSNDKIVITRVDDQHYTCAVTSL